MEHYTDSTGKKWQFRYVQYARAHGHTPPKMLAQDKVKFPGGCMGGYILWITSRWRDFGRSLGFEDREFQRLSISGQMHDQFDLWLEDWVSQQDVQIYLPLEEV